VRWSSEGCGDIDGGVLGDGVGGEGESPCMLMYFDGRVGGSKESSAKACPLPSAVEVSDLRSKAGNMEDDSSHSVPPPPKHMHIHTTPHSS